MSGAAKYVWAAIAVAVAAHLGFIFATPRVLMNLAIDRLSVGGFNQWRIADRITEASRTIVRPSPDFAYSACPYDLSGGPVLIHVEPWAEYWSLSLYAGDSDNFFVIDDREVESSVSIILTRNAHDIEAPPNTRVVESPSNRGVALIRRLAPTLDAYNAAARIAQGDVCARAG